MHSHNSTLHKDCDVLQWSVQLHSCPCLWRGILQHICWWYLSILVLNTQETWRITCKAPKLYWWCKALDDTKLVETKWSWDRVHHVLPKGYLRTGQGFISIFTSRKLWKAFDKSVKSVKSTSTFLKIILNAYIISRIDQNNSLLLGLPKYEL